MKVEGWCTPCRQNGVWHGATVHHQLKTGWGAKNILGATEKSRVWLWGGGASLWAVSGLRLPEDEKGLQFRRESGRLLVVLEQNRTIYEKILAEACLIVKKEKQRYTILKMIPVFRSLACINGRELRACSFFTTVIQNKSNYMCYLWLSISTNLSSVLTINPTSAEVLGFPITVQ